VATADETNDELKQLAADFCDAKEDADRAFARMHHPETRTVLGWLVFTGAYADRNPAFFLRRADAEAWCRTQGIDPTTDEGIEPAFGVFLFDNDYRRDPSTWGVSPSQKESSDA
jgi:hypothetical protein